VDRYATRRQELAERMRAEGVDLYFCPPSGDLEYLTGTKRRVPTFGNISYTHGWVAGAFFRPDAEPLFVLPRMVAEFDLPGGAGGDAVIVAESDDGPAVFEDVARRLGTVRTLAVEPRTWSETLMHLLGALDGPRLVNGEQLTNPMRRIKATDELAAMAEACSLADRAMGAVADHVAVGVAERELAEEVDHLMVADGSRGVSFDTAVWSMGPATERDASDRHSSAAIRPGWGVSFDFGAVIDGYCSDFGRTVAVGEPSDEYRRVHDLVMAAQAAGIAAVRPGALASEVDAATRAVIDEGGYGKWFRHRTGHCIGLDVHERPFISWEDDTPLEEGMTFTIEPSVFWPGRVGVRVEDIIVCEAGGGRKLNEFPTTMLVTGG
jgi:Xaa-Pro aminopeptidase